VDLYIHSPIRLRGVMLNWLSTGTTLPLPYTYIYITIDEIIQFALFRPSIYVCLFLINLLVLTL
jgi:hypothetical protein